MPPGVRLLSFATPIPSYSLNDPFRASTVKLKPSDCLSAVGPVRGCWLAVATATVLVTAFDPRRVLRLKISAVAQPLGSLTRNAE